MFKINFKKGSGLTPVIIQDYQTGEVLMLGYMNNKALAKTIKNGYVYFWSRKRKKIWMKGEQSGNRLKVKKFFLDCDKDAILIKTELVGLSVCHTGNKSCFYQNIWG